MAYKFDVLQKIGEQDPTIDESVIVDRFVDLTGIGGVSYSNNRTLTNPLTGERYNSSLYNVNATATSALIANNPVSIDIGLPLTATQADPQITDITSGVGWNYRITAYSTPSATNRITIRFALRWGNNVSWDPVRTITLGTPAKNIVLYFVRINAATHGDQYGLVLDYPAVDDTIVSTCILLRTSIWGDQAAPLPVTPTGGGGGFGTHDNTTDVNINIGYKNSRFLSGILGDGFHFYYVPDYSELIKAMYYHINGINNLSDWANNTMALFLAPANYVVSAMSMPCTRYVFDRSGGVYDSSIKMGGLLSWNVNAFSLSNFWGDSKEFSYDFEGKMYFDDYRDFEPFTKISLYLPYIGTVPLKASECNGGRISVVYRFEGISGKCLAMIKTTDRNGRQTGYYQYGGNAGFALPWIGNNGGGSQMIHSAASAIAPIDRMSTEKYNGNEKITDNDIKTAKALAVGKIFDSYIQNTRPHMQGGFGVNTGALGADDVVLIVQRAQFANPENYHDIHGFQTATGGVCGDYSGYTEFNLVELVDCEATQPEQDEILQLLKRGVYL